METKFARSAQRNRLIPICYCGAHNNKDGKCAPIENDPEKGYCHSCDKFFDTAEKKPYTPNLQPPKPIDYHPTDLLNKTLKNNKNKFVIFLKSIFNSGIVDQVTKMYNVGSSKYWDGSTIFWQVDDLQRVRYGKLMLYNQDSGKRVKEPFNHFTNIHTVLRIKEFNHKQCLFGLHLLPNNKKPIAVVESEKTAIIMSLVDKSYLWLATGGKGNFKYDVLQPLEGKEVFVFPDVEESLWKEVSERLNETGFKISVSDALENKGFPKGYDLADMVLYQMEEAITRKNRIAENQTVTKAEITALADYSVTEIPVLAVNQPNTDLERLKIGIQLNTDDINSLAKKIIPENDSRTQREILFSLNEIEGLSSQDGKDLILTMQIKQIIEKTSIGTYFLSNSTPF